MILEFIKEHLILILEGIALLTGLVFAKKFWNTPVRMILVYLFLVFSIELTALSYGGHWIYNVLSFLELLIFTYIFYYSVEGVNYKKTVLFASLGCILILILDRIFITETFGNYLSIGFGFTSLGLALMCFLYILEMIKTEKVLHQNRELLYWVVIGLFIYHLCNLPATVMVNSITESTKSIDIILNIQDIAGIGMYFCFIFGFIWSRHSS